MINPKQHFLTQLPFINIIQYLEYIKILGRKNVLSKNNMVLDLSYYELAGLHIVAIRDFKKI